MTIQRIIVLIMSLSVFDKTGTTNTGKLIIHKSNNDSDNYTSSSSSSDLNNSVPIKWTDTNSVKALILKWKNHEKDFKNTQIRNSKVWQMIADELKEENPLWSFNSIQCENKFRDLRKSYTKIKDHNNQSGAELKTCKFYDEMETVLGEKPIVKPISISSTLKKRVNLHPKTEVLSYSSDNDEKENDLKPNRKKSKTARELEKWNAQRKIEIKEREKSRMERHKEKMDMQEKALELYKKQMEKLLEKL